MADPSTVGGGHHFLKSFAVISSMNVYFAVASDGRVANPWLWQALIYAALYRAVIVHFYRDKSRFRADPGQLQGWIMALIEMVPLPNRWLSVTCQWRIWTPLMLWFSSGLVAILCPATAALMKFTAIISFALPGAYHALVENRKRGRMESMIAKAERAMGPAPYVPRNGKRGAWLNRLQQQLRGQWEAMTEEGEQVSCPGCRASLQSEGIANQTLVTCTECETDFVIDRGMNSEPTTAQAGG